MVALLEARAVITAKDETAAAFASVEARIAEIHSRVAGLNTTMGSVAPGAGRVAMMHPAIASTSAAAAGRPSTAVMTAPRVLPAESSAFDQLLGWGAAVTGISTLYGGIKQATERAHETIRMQAAGMEPEEIKKGTEIATGLSKQFPAIDESDMMHMLRNARSIVGSYEEAAKLMEPLARLRIVAQGANASADPKELDEEFDKLVKGLEIKGVTQDGPKFKEYMQGIAKGLNAFGDTLKPYQYYEMFKYGRQATPALSEKFVLGTGPSLAQELGGSSYGKAVSAFNAELVNNIAGHKQLTALADLGLLKEEDLDRLKSGEVKAVKPDHHIQGWRTAQEDPNEWVKQFLLPAIEAKGITDKGEVLQKIGTLFGNQMASQLVGILATQQTRINKDLAMLEHAGGLETSDVFSKGDPTIAGRGLANSLKNMLADLIPSNEQLAGVLSAGSAALNWLRFDPKRDQSNLDDFMHTPNAERWNERNPGFRIDATADAPEQALWRENNLAQSANWRAGYRRNDLASEMGRESARGAALGSGPLTVSLDPNSKATVDVRLRVDEGSLLRIITDMVAKATGSLTATVGRMDSSAAPSRVGGVGHR